MLTYELKKAPGVPLYEALYRCIRGDILSGTLAPGERLPSKRALAQNLEVSKITVETAYAQLLAEGYIRAQEKVGYFVEHQPQALTQPPIPAHEESAPEGKWLDLTGAGTEKFPFSVWSRLQREVMLDYGEKLLLPLPPQGIPELRMAIAEHLADAADGVYEDLFLSHADCIEDAQLLKEEILKIAPFKNVIISTIGPIVGASVGPGTVIAFCRGKEVLIEGNE